VGFFALEMRGINPFTAIPLLVVALLLGLLGGLQLTRALPKSTLVARGSIFGSQYEPGGRYSGQSWDVYLDVPGHGSQIAYSHALYNVVQATDPNTLPAVKVHLRGTLVTDVELRGHTYHTQAVSKREAWVEAIILLALCVLTLYFLVRTARRDMRASRALAVPAQG
jgi:hypothetical protein